MNDTSDMYTPANDTLYTSINATGLAHARVMILKHKNEVFEQLPA